MLLGGAIHGGVTLLGELRDLFLQPGNLLPLRVPVVQCPRDRIRSLHRSRDRVRASAARPTGNSSRSSVCARCRASCASLAAFAAS